MVNKGSEVDIGDKLFDSAATNDIVIDIAEQLRIKSEEIFQYLDKLIGEKVHKNEIIAEKKSFLSTKSVVSPASGVIRTIDHITGEITLSAVLENSPSKEKIVKSAFFSGSIEDIEGNLLTVSIPKAISYRARLVSADGGGEVWYVKNDADFQTATTQEIAGKIVCLKELKPHIQVKCEALGAAGFIITKGNTSDELPTCVLDRLRDYDTMIDQGKKYAVFTTHDNACILYD